MPDRPHMRWSMDFVSDSLMDGRTLRVLNRPKIGRLNCHGAKPGT